MRVASSRVRLSLCRSRNCQLTCPPGTIKAFGNRTIHTYHTEGAGGGHAPDIITVCEFNNVLPSSTNPTRPYANNTLDEHLDVRLLFLFFLLITY